MSKLLTFELDQTNDLLEIHANREGLIYLKQTLESLIQADHNDHVHMMVPAWGGDELTEEQQCTTNKLIPHVKIFTWIGS